MGKRHSRPSIQAWISRESPEGGCVIINDTSSQTRLLEEILKQKRSVTSYEGYLVNEEDNLDPGVLDHHDSKTKSVESFPIEIVDLPAEPDGKPIDIHFVKEGNIDETTQLLVRPEDIDCGVSIRSMSSDRQQWSFSLYNFEDNGRISKEDLTNLVKSIYDALGKSVDKANKKSSHAAVKKVKVHISLSKEKGPKDMRGATVVPRREVVIGAEDCTTESEKQLKQLLLKERGSSQDPGVPKKPRRRKNGYSTVQVLNNDLGKERPPPVKCKCCSREKYENKMKSIGQPEKNSNLVANKPPARRKTEPGGSFTPEQKPGYNPEELAQLAEKKLKIRSQRRSRRRPTSPGGNIPGFTSPGGHSPGNISPVGIVSGYTSPVPITGGSRKDVPLDPSYAYHAEENSYVYMHAAPRPTPFEEPKCTRRHKTKHRRPRDGGEKPSGIPSYPGATSVVHRHEHVHHHYHHYGEKR